MKVKKLEAISEITTIKEGKDLTGLTIPKGTVLHVMNDKAPRHPKDGYQILVVRVDNGTGMLDLMPETCVRDYDVLGTPQERLQYCKEVLAITARDIKDLRKMKRSATYKSLSQFSKDLHQENENKATSRQIDAIDLLTGLVVDGFITQKEAERIVKRSIKS